MPGHTGRLTVRLRFVLSSAARVTFVILGPAPSCSPAGRFVIAGHSGLNSVRFAGRVQGRLLGPGLYTIVPQPSVGAKRPPGPRAAIMIDAHGVRPATRVQRENCRSAIKTEPLLPLTPRHAGVAGAIATEPATPADTPATRADKTVADKPREFQAWILQSTGWALLTIAVLLCLLASVTLLGLAAVEPAFPLLRAWRRTVLGVHRRQVALSGAAFVVAAGMLFLLARLPM